MLKLDLRKSNFLKFQKTANVQNTNTEERQNREPKIIETQIN